MDEATFSNVTFASLPPATPNKLKLAFLRALRTAIQAIVAAVPASGAGAAILTTGYWQALGYSCLTAVIAGLVAFLQNVAAFLPADVSVKTAEPAGPRPAAKASRLS